MGRPTGYNERVAKQILDYYAKGKTLADITKKGLPSRWTVYQWRKQYPEFGELFEMAIECCTDAKIEKVLNRIETCKDTRQAKLLDVLFKSTSWYISKINKKYSDRIQLDVSQTIDIGPALQLAMERMKRLGTGEVLQEAECNVVLHATLSGGES